MVVGEVTSRKYWSNQDDYSVVFDGTAIEVTVTSTPSVVRKWIQTALFKHRHRRHRDQLVVGLGVQWTPPLRGRSEPAAEILQLCIGRHCLIIQLVHLNSVPRLLHRFLTDRNHTFVGIWNSQDNLKLQDTRFGLSVWKLIDLRMHLVRDDGESMKRESFGRIVEEYLEIEGCWLDPAVSMSDWDEEDLSDAQVLQACVKARVAFLIGTNIRAWELS